MKSCFLSPILTLVWSTSDGSPGSLDRSDRSHGDGPAPATVDARLQVRGDGVTSARLGTTRLASRAPTRAPAFATKAVWLVRSTAAIAARLGVRRNGAGPARGEGMAMGGIAIRGFGKRTGDSRWIMFPFFDFRRCLTQD